MSVNVRYDGGYRFVVQTRGHECVLDLPQSGGGTDKSLTPPEAFVGSVVACIGVYLVEYCERVGLPTEGLALSGSFETTGAPKRIGRIAIEITLPPGIPDNRLRALHKVADSCLIHQTLCQPPEVEISLVQPENV